MTEEIHGGSILPENFGDGVETLAETPLRIQRENKYDGQ